MSKSDIVQASEIGLYVYCKRAWWLKHVKGHQPSNYQDLQRGARIHESHGRMVLSVLRWQHWAYFFLGLAILSGLLFVWQIIMTP